MNREVNTFSVFHEIIVATILVALLYNGVYNDGLLGLCVAIFYILIIKVGMKYNPQRLVKLMGCAMVPLTFTALQIFFELFLNVILSFILFYYGYSIVGFILAVTTILEVCALLWVRNNVDYINKLLETVKEKESKPNE